MSRSSAANKQMGRASHKLWWAAMISALALVLVGPEAAAQASNGGPITISPPAGGLFVPGSSLTAGFSTDGALAGNTPLSVSFVSSTSGATVRATYAILSAAGTTYTISIPIPELAPGEYIIVIEGPEINGGKLTSTPIIVTAPTPTPLPTPVRIPIGTQAHVVPPGPSVPGGAIAAAAAGALLALSLALLIVPPLRRRGNRTLR